jgi:hemoglobin
MGESPTVLQAIGGEAGCRRLSANFYARVRKDPVLRPLFPGKTLKCAIEEFAAFLIQFLGGDEEQTQRRWWLSLRDSHARHHIGPAERAAWLKHMSAELDASPLDEGTRSALKQFFTHSSAYITHQEAPPPAHEELTRRWTEQRALDNLIRDLATGQHHDALAAAPRFASRPSVFSGVLVRMLQSGSPNLIRFVIDAVEHDHSLITRRSSGRTLLHFSCGAGCIEVVEALLRLGADPNIQDTMGHTPLYRVANECAFEAGPRIVQALIQAGARVNEASGVTRATPLHMAARRGHLAIARVLLEAGAETDVRDGKGDTPFQRAINCRKSAVAQLLSEAAH